ncbi:hypothetical protein GCM10020255_067090 [Rhodococcus baikonurensis]
MDVDLVAAAAPRSDQINADDLIGGPQIVTITEVRKETVNSLSRSSPPSSDQAGHIAQARA